jgi:hypothetical protein
MAISELRAYYWERVEPIQLDFLGDSGDDGSDEESAGDGGESSEQAESSGLDEVSGSEFVDFITGLACMNPNNISFGNLDFLTCATGGWNGSTPGACPPARGEANLDLCLITSPSHPGGAAWTLICTFYQMWTHASELPRPANVGEFPIP